MPSKISISPTAPTVIVGETATFTVTATDTAGTTSNVTADSIFSMTDPAGSLEKNIYRAGRVGTWAITADYQSLTATTNVTVNPGALAELSINPNSAPEIVNVGEKVKFTTKAYDAENNVLSDIPITWSVTNELGEISTGGTFTASKVGTGAIVASSNGITAQVDVRVQAAPVVSTVNTNTTTNANQATNANTNTAVIDTNTAVVNENANEAVTTETSADKTTCSAGKLWLWSILLLVLLGTVALLYAIYPVSMIWPAVAALVGTVVVVFLQRKYGCDNQSWWSWIMVIGTVLLSALALRQSPPPTNKPSIQ